MLIEMDSTELKVKKIIQDGDLPLIGKWTNTAVGDSAKVQFYKSNIVGVQDSKFIYTGTIEEDNLYKTYLVVRKKNSNKVVAYDTASVTLSIETNAAKVTSPTIQENRQESVRQLNKLFGTKKAKRLTELRERMKTNIHTIQEHLETTVQDMNEEENESELKDLTEMKNASQQTLVPINWEAQSVENVFNLNDFLTVEDLLDLKPHAKAVLKCSFDDINCSCEYVKQEIGRIQSNSCSLPKSEKLKRISMLLYADIIFQFLCVPVPKLKSFSMISDQFSNKVRNLFSITTNNKIQRSASLRDKSFSYMLVMFLLASERFLIDLEHISKSIQNISVTKLIKLLKAIGAQPVPKCKMLYHIKLPLPELKLESSFKQRKRK